MYIFLMVIHVFVCLVLIAVILLQAGRGGGLSDMVGGGQTQSLLGTQTNTFMTRATEVCAVIFVITSLSLAIISTHKGKSLIERETLARSLKTGAPAIPAAETKAPAPKEEVKEAAAPQAPTAESAAPAPSTTASETK